jgi:hypothetical protein
MKISNIEFVYVKNVVSCFLRIGCCIKQKRIVDVDMIEENHSYDLIIFTSDGKKLSFPCEMKGKQTKRLMRIMDKIVFEDIDLEMKNVYIYIFLYIY